MKLVNPIQKHKDCYIFYQGENFDIPLSSFKIDNRYGIVNLAHLHHVLTGSFSSLFSPPAGGRSKKILTEDFIDLAIKVLVMSKLRGENFTEHSSGTCYFAEEIIERCIIVSKPRLHINATVKNVNNEIVIHDTDFDSESAKMEIQKLFGMSSDKLQKMNCRLNKFFMTDSAILKLMLTGKSKKLSKSTSYLSFNGYIHNDPFKRDITIIPFQD